MSTTPGRITAKGLRDFALFLLGAGIIVHEVVIVDGPAEVAVLLTGMSLLGLIAPLRLFDVLRGFTSPDQPSPTPPPPPPPPHHPVAPPRPWPDDDGWAP